MTIFGSYVLFWFLLGFMFLILEVLTPGIVFVFFGLGAWLVMGVVYFLPHLGSPFQFLIFTVSSVIFLIMLRRHISDIFRRDRKEDPTDSLSESMFAENFLGKEVDVIKEIFPGRPGLVELNGTNWTAKSDQPLATGDRAVVINVANLEVMVKKLGS
jgi:membrane protein implicated in regulation of membrane protease activity